MRILVMGATGMLGYQVMRTCLTRKLDVHAIVRNKTVLVKRLGENIERLLHTIDDVKNVDQIEEIVSSLRPDYVINCIGIVKQSSLAEDYFESIAINSLLPHQLQKLGERYQFRLIHVSTDCVFDGTKGCYKENELPNAYDLYGKSKHLGEVGYGSGITIRTSIIGHEITNNSHGLLEWFLSQNGKVKGYKKAIFSGLTTLELTNVILDVVIPGNIPAGVYHVSSHPISKYDLVHVIAKVYNKQIEIEPSEDVIIDRSLDGDNFVNLTGYKVPVWEQQIRDMYADFKKGF